jgi:hypothetical protein
LPTKMKLGIGFTYLIVAGTVLNLLGKGVYHLTHPFDLGDPSPSFQKLLFGLLATFAFYRAGHLFEVPTAKRVLRYLSFAAFLKTLSYVVNNYISAPVMIDVFVYLLALASEGLILYACVVHLRSMRESKEV